MWLCVSINPPPKSIFGRYDFYINGFRDKPVKVVDEYVYNPVRVCLHHLHTISRFLYRWRINLFINTVNVFYIIISRNRTACVYGFFVVSTCIPGSDGGSIRIKSCVSTVETQSISNMCDKLIAFHCRTTRLNTTTRLSYSCLCWFLKIMFFPWTRPGNCRLRRFLHVHTASNVYRHRESSKKVVYFIVFLIFMFI